MSDAGTIRELSEGLVRALTDAGKTMTSAESCTGGWIAKAITDVAGSSACFAYGIVSYSNAAKERLLGVAPTALAENGAVSGVTVAAMAEGALQLSGADLSVAVSGIAGPDGGTDEKPVGTVWFAWSVRNGSRFATSSEQQQFSGDREAVRRLSVAHALRGLQARLA